MKTKLIECLKKRVLLVDGLPKEATNFKLLKLREYFHIDWDLPPKSGFTRTSGAVLLFKYFGGRKKYPENLTFFSTLKDITDEQCEELVERFPKSPIYGFRNYRFYSDFFLTAKESFLSALEVENVLFKNPHGKYVKIMLPNKFKEAEQNVFSPETLIFVEQ